MLDLAMEYEESIQKAFRKTWLNDKYKFFNYAPSYGKIYLDNTTHMEHAFVSMDKDENVIGFIRYSINRDTHAAIDLIIINFGGNDLIFAKDLLVTIKDIFEKFNFNKLNFSVIIGNPVEKHYDRLIERFGGRVIGISKDDVKLHDGKIYDRKLYEISYDEYVSSKNLRKIKNKYI